MQLLVSVASAAEAGTALTGGADIIDAKNPLGGALGAVSVEVLRDIHAAVAGARPVTAALGDATDEARVERDARSFARGRRSPRQDWFRRGRVPRTGRRTCGGSCAGCHD